MPCYTRNMLLSVFISISPRNVEGWVISEYHTIVQCHVISLWCHRPSLNGHEIPVGQPREYCEIPALLLRDFLNLPSHFFPHWPKPSVSRTRWKNCLNVNISAFFLWSVSQSVSEFVDWDLLWGNSEAAILSTLKRYPHNDSAFYLHFSKMAAVDNSGTQLLPHSTPSLQVSVWPKCNPHLHCHKAGFLTADKTWGEIRIIVWPQIPSTSSKGCNVDM